MRTVSFVVVALLMAALCTRLGFWQLSRLAERRALNASVAERLALPTLSELPTGGLDSMAYRRIELTGSYDATRPVVEVFRSRNGVPGVYVVQALITPDSSHAVLVERGWAAAPDARSVDLNRFQVESRLNIEGYLVSRVGGGPPADSGESGSAATADRVTSWPVFIQLAVPSELQDRFPYQLHPMVVRRTGGDGAPDLTALDPPPPDEGSHLTYAVQWFSFALIALVGGAIWAVRMRGEESRA